MADSLDLGVKPDANKYERAAVYVRDAMHGRTTMAHDKWSFFYHRIYINLIYVNVYRLMSVALLALAFWEGPSKHAPDALADAELRWVYYSLEVFFLLFFCFDSYLQFKDFGKARFMRKRYVATRPLGTRVELTCDHLCCPITPHSWVRIKLACMALFLLDLVVSIIIPNNYLRLVRALWPVFFIERNENVRKIVGSLLHAVPKILNVVVLVLVHITLFGVFAYVFFAGIDDDNCEAWVPTQVSSERCSTYITEGCSNYFQTLGQSIMQLFILGTTANFPEVGGTMRCVVWVAQPAAVQRCTAFPGHDAGLSMQPLGRLVLRGVSRDWPVFPCQPHNCRHVHHVPRTLQGQDLEETQSRPQGPLLGVLRAYQRHPGSRRRLHCSLLSPDARCVVRVNVWPGRQVFERRVAASASRLRPWAPRLDRSLRSWPWISCYGMTGCVS